MKHNTEKSTVFEKAEGVILKEMKKEQSKAKHLSGFKNAINVYFYSQNSKTEKYLSNLTYPLVNEDKNSYLNDMRSAAKEMLRDNTATKEETKEFEKKLKDRTKKLKNKLLTEQVEYQKVAFTKARIDAVGMMKKTKFGDALAVFDKFKAKLAPLQDAGVIVPDYEAEIQKEKFNIKDSKLFYDKILVVYDNPQKRGRQIVGMEPGYIGHKNPENGNIVLVPLELDQQKGEIKGGYSSSEKRRVNWFDLMLEMNKKKLTVKEVKVTEKPNTDPPEYGIDKNNFTAGDYELDNEKLVFAEKQLLNKIGELFNGKGFEVGKNTDKKLYKKAIWEQMASLGMYFSYFKIGGKIGLLPTDMYKNASFEEKVQLFAKILTGLSSIYSRLEIENSIKEESDKAKKLFYKGERAMMTGNFLDAYSYYNQFNKTDIEFTFEKSSEELSKLSPKERGKIMANSKKEREEALKMSQEAMKQMKVASFGILNIAERYYLAAATSKISVGSIKQALGVIKQVRKKLESNKIANLHEALDEIDKNWRKTESISPKGRYLSRGAERKGGGTSQLFPTSTMQGSRKIMRVRGHLLKRLAMVSEYENDGDRKKAFIGQAHNARENKLYGAAAVLYKEGMRNELFEHRRFMQKKKFGYYWDKMEKIKDEYSLLDIAKKFLKENKGVFAWEKPVSSAKIMEAAKMMEKSKILVRKSIGKKKFNKLTKNQKERLIQFYFDKIKMQKIKQKENAYVMKNYLDSLEGDKYTVHKNVKSKAAREYISMTNHFDDWRPWNLSDKRQDELKEQIHDYGIDAIMLATSFGVGNLVAKGVQIAGTRLVARYAAKRGLGMIGKRVGMMAVRGNAFVAGDIMTFHTAHSGFQTAKGAKGLFEGKTFWKGALHSAAFVTPMHIGSKLLAPGITKFFQGMSKEAVTAFQKKLQAFKVRAGTVATFEAPFMTVLNQMVSKLTGENVPSFASGYGHALFEISKMIIGTKALNTATGNIFPRAVAKLEVRSKIHELKMSTNPINKERAKILEQMNKEGKLSPEAMLQFASLQPSHMTGLKSYMSENPKLLIALKAAMGGKKIPTELQPIYDKFAKQMKKFGLKPEQAFKFLGSMNFRNLAKLEVENQSIIVRSLKGAKEKIVNWLKFKKLKTIWKRFEKKDMDYEALSQKDKSAIPPEMRDIMVNLGKTRVNIKEQFRNLDQGLAPKTKDVMEALKVGSSMRNSERISILNRLSENQITEYINKGLITPRKINQLVFKFLVEGNYNGLTVIYKKLGRKIRVKDIIEKRAKEELSEMFENGQKISLEYMVLYNTVKSLIPNFIPSQKIKFGNNLVKSFVRRMKFSEKEFSDFKKQALEQGMTLSEFREATVLALKERLKSISENAENASGTFNYKKSFELLKQVKITLKKVGIENINKLDGVGIKESVREISRKFFENGNILFHEAARDLLNIKYDHYYEKSALTENPFGHKYRGLEKAEFMSHLMKAYDRIPNKFKNKWNTDQIYEALLRMNPGMKPSDKQKKLIFNMLQKSKKSLKFVNDYRKGTPEAKHTLIRNIIEAEAPFLKNFPKLKYKVYTENDHLFIYLPGPLYEGLFRGFKTINQYRKLMETYDSKKSPQGHNASNIKYGNGIDGTMISFMNKDATRGKRRSRGVEKHEREHGITSKLGISGNYEGIAKKTYEMKYDSKANVDKIFQFVKQRYIREELYSMIKEGALQKKGIDSMWRMFDKYFIEAPLNNIFAPYINPKMKQYYNFQKEKFKIQVLKAMTDAAKIINYPGGYRLLRITDINHWSKLHRDLKGKYGESERK